MFGHVDGEGNMGWEQEEYNWSSKEQFFQKKQKCGATCRKDGENT